MIIVGVGAGPQMLTAQAAQAVAQARLIYGSERAIDLVREHINPDCIVRVIEDYKKLHDLAEDAVVLSTGDPMLSGLGYLKGRVIPGHLQPAGGLCPLKNQSAQSGSYHGSRPQPGP